MWASICFDTNKNFCDESYNINFDWYKLEIKRWAHNQWHELFIEVSNNKYEEAHEAWRRFLSEICWLYKTTAEVLTYWWWGNKTRFLVQEREFFRIWNGLSLDEYEQITSDTNKRLALSIYREWFNSNSKFYSFLCYARIINMVWWWNEQINWINNNLDKIKKKKEFKEYFNKINVKDIWNHLYVSWRCAIAHANINSNWPIADADNFKDTDKIFEELKFIKELAEIYIKFDLKLIDEHELYKIRLFRWFKKLFTQNIINMICLSCKNLDKTIFPKIPNFSFKIYKYKNKFNFFSKLDFKISSVHKGKIILSNYEQDYPLHFMIEIDFIKKNIDLDILNADLNKNHYLFSNKYHIEYLEFLKQCCLNWRIEIYNTENWELISRLNSYIPCNVRINFDYIDEKIAKLNTRL